jgi:predicted membrane channel-forming protein YqfA (hemolysin III family)
MRLSLKAFKQTNIPVPQGRIQAMETGLGIIVVLLVIFACTGPFIGQPAEYHAFADQRVFLGIPFAFDVLSNLPFALWGAVGVWLAWPVAAGGRDASSTSRAQGRHAMLFFAGLILTAACSAWYHLNPGDAGLAIDRCGMVVAFAGLLGLATGGRVSACAGACMAALVMLLGPLTVAAWSLTGNVMPWLVLQFGGLLLILCMACLQPRSDALPVRWFLVIAFYVLAKCLELSDHHVYELAGHAVSGHSLKHLIASCAAWPVVRALLQQRKQLSSDVTVW